MKKKRNWSKSKFTTLTRISKESYEWIKQNKRNHTIAGYLDLIINEYKNGLEPIQNAKTTDNIQ